MKNEVQITPSPYRIHISPPDRRVSIWGNVKTAIWNFVLPPHLRLEVVKRPSIEGIKDEKPV